MATIDHEYIENNVEKILDFIENYPHAENNNHLYYIGTRTTNPTVLKAIYAHGVTAEMLVEYKNTLIPIQE